MIHTVKDFGVFVSYEIPILLQFTLVYFQPLPLYSIDACPEHPLYDPVFATMAVLFIMYFPLCAVLSAAQLKTQKLIPGLFANHDSYSKYHFRLKQAMKLNDSWSSHWHSYSFILFYYEDECTLWVKFLICQEISNEFQVQRGLL